MSKRKVSVEDKTYAVNLYLDGKESQRRIADMFDVRDDGELRFGYDPAIHARRLRVYHRPRRLRMASRISIFFAARRFEPLNSMG